MKVSPDKRTELNMRKQLLWLQGGPVSGHGPGPGGTGSARCPFCLRGSAPLMSQRLRAGSPPSAGKGSAEQQRGVPRERRRRRGRLLALQVRDARREAGPAGSASCRAGPAPPPQSLCDALILLPSSRGQENREIKPARQRGGALFVTRVWTAVAARWHFHFTLPGVPSPPGVSSPARRVQPRPRPRPRRAAAGAVVFCFAVRSFSRRQSPWPVLAFAPAVNITVVIKIIQIKFIIWRPDVYYFLVLTRHNFMVFSLLLFLFFLLFLR